MSSAAMLQNRRGTSSGAAGTAAKTHPNHSSGTLHMDEPPTDVSWEAEFANLIGEISEAQGELLTALVDKRALLMNSDAEGLSAISRREQQIIDRLERCLDRRLRLLERAADEGHQATSLRTLAQSLQPVHRLQLGSQLDETSRRARQVQQEALTNWVIAQRTLVHLSQLLEIIATGGRLQPTYGSETAISSGALLNQIG